MKKIDIQKLMYVVTAVFIIAMITHAYVLFNYAPVHDGVMTVTIDQNWQISLGRFLQPMYIAVRGNINAPWLIGVLAFTYLSAGIYFVLQIFEIRRKIIVWGGTAFYYSCSINSIIISLY